jgi:hypothetical protein
MRALALAVWLIWAHASEWCTAAMGAVYLFYALSEQSASCVCQQLLLPSGGRVLCCRGVSALAALLREWMETVVSDYGSCRKTNHVAVLAACRPVQVFIP